MLWRRQCEAQPARPWERRRVHWLEVMLVWATWTMHARSADRAGFVGKRTAMIEPAQPQRSIDDAHGVRNGGPRQVCHEADGPPPINLDLQRCHSPGDEPEAAAGGVDDH
jgi:hypothetical protein